MECTVKATPKPDIVWYHESKLLSQSTKISWRMEEKGGDVYYIRLELKVCTKIGCFVVFILVFKMLKKLLKKRQNHMTKKQLKSLS